MDLQADSEPECIVVSTSDYTESTPCPGVVSLYDAGNVKSFVKSFNFLPSPRGRFQTSGTSGTHTRKYYSETKPGRRAAKHPVNNYNYYISGGFGGSGGEGGDQGGDGGAGHGPIVYLGQTQARKPSEFQTIRLGDINLIKEFKGVCFGVVGCQAAPGASVRRVYTAKLEGRESGHMTVAMYEGDGAEEAWNQHLEKYEAVRHPHIMQLYGLMSTEGLYAMVFHDELIPYAQFLCRFEHSPILSTYIIGYCTMEFKEATSYIYSVFRKSGIDYTDFPAWIRSTTGKLCLDLAKGGPETDIQLDWLPNVDILRLENVPLHAPDSEDIIISSLSEDTYHELCSGLAIARLQRFQVSTQHPVGLGIFRLDSQHETCLRITEPHILPWENLDWDHHGRTPGDLLPNSWIRYDPRRLFAFKLGLNLSFSLSFSSSVMQKAWLAQANHIFSELQEEAHVEDYVCVYHVQFSLRIADKRHIPEGYLFVCPLQDFCTGIEPHAGLYQWPACPAYWSLDPSGADRLSMEDARNLEFPAIHIETIMFGHFWDHSVYEGLRRFHEGKGLDQESQEVARRLGYPLYEVLSDRVPFPARKVQDWPLRCKQDHPALCREFGHYL